MFPKAHTAYREKEKRVWVGDGWLECTIPYLFLHICNRAAKQFDKVGYRASFNDDLSLLRRSRGDIGQCPSSFKLKQESQSVSHHHSYRRSFHLSYLKRRMVRMKEFNKSRHHTTSNHLFNRGIHFTGQEFTKVRSRLELSFNISGVDGLDHIRKNVIQLQ